MFQTIKHEKNDVKYVVFEFLDTNEISAAIYTPEENFDEGFLSDIETDEEWEMIDGLLESYYEESEEFEPFDEDELED